MSIDWEKLKFNPKQPPPKVIEGADLFDDQAAIASYFSSSAVEEAPLKKKLACDYKRGDRVRIIKTGEIMQMTSVEVLNGSFFAVNLKNENDRRMLKVSAVESADN